MRDLEAHSRRTQVVTVRRLVGMGALSGVALLGVTAIASATTTPATAHDHGALGIGIGRHGDRPIVDGKVTATGANSFTVLDRSSKSYTVNVTGSTTYREKNVANVGIADVTVGTYVDVVGTVSGTDVSATTVRIEATETLAPPGAPGVRPAAAGKVTAIGTDSFTVANRAGTTLTVDVTNSTTYKEPGVATAAFGDLKVGDFVVVNGTLSGTTVAASDVHFGPGLAPNAEGLMPAARGKVTAIGTDSFTVTNRMGTTLTVNVTGSTTYKEPGTAGAGFSDLKVGDFVVARGTLSGTTVSATDVHFDTVNPMNDARGLHEFRGMHRPGAGLRGGPGAGMGSGPEA